MSEGPEKVRDEWCAEYVKQREALAAMMIRTGLATGHGDTFESLLVEAEWQIMRLQRIAGERYSPPPHDALVKAPRG